MANRMGMCDSHPFGYVQIRISGYSGIFVLRYYLGQARGQNNGLAQFSHQSLEKILNSHHVWCEDCLIP
eukprot:6181027-Pleurochrysis_carterae.AAC.1